MTWKDDIRNEWSKWDEAGLWVAVVLLLGCILSFALGWLIGA